MTLPKITTKQQALIHLIYQYRFLERTQIQAFLKHKDKRRISAWLKDLREKQYIDWIYLPDDPIQKTKPAIYYMGLNGIRFLRELEHCSSDELRKRYKESSRRQDFISICLLIADCCLNLEAKSIGDTRYSFVVETDYTDPESDYHFLNDLKPHLYFEKQYGEDVKNYLLEIFDARLPRHQLRKRILDYVESLTDDTWGSELDGQLPIILMACPTIADLIYVKRRVSAKLEDAWNGDDIHIRLATYDKLKQQGLTAKIWEEA